MLVIREPNRLKLTKFQVYVRKNLKEWPEVTTYGFWLRTLELPGHKTRQKTTFSRAQSSQATRVLLNPGQVGIAGVVLMERRHSCSSGSLSQVRLIKIGFDPEFHPQFSLPMTEEPTNYYLGHLGSNTLRTTDQQSSSAVLPQIMSCSTMRGWTGHR